MRRSTAGTPEDDPRARASRPVALTPMLTAALEAFYENGYHGATVRDIASRVGVTVPALYYHHENKEALLYALLDTSISRLDTVCHLVDIGGGSPVQRFNDLVECLVRHMAVSGKLAYLDGELRSLTPEHRRGYIAKRSAIEARLLRAVEEGVAEGSFDLAYPRDTVRAMLGTIQAVATWYRPDGELSLDDLVKRYLSILSRMAGLRSA
ncbi:TetR/AcrR family transcriptional regulator [Micromonospora zingiberis]|uniref:TetR/AcrR family transcriptional regulator n=1 Tax=Micromonospora zingiberis TaxID=2053011 RepID=A0A4R0GGW5_9ACTN|nr:TetR/AcrR family transcriptional regulator [Micromonospora zingiberis]TCB95473.1 TetR/AcrR family transcriptional regulator [Micromonospora zingiberis]